jgi:hypothetical protein
LKLPVLSTKIKKNNNEYYKWNGIGWRKEDIKSIPTPIGNVLIVNNNIWVAGGRI